jgi:S-adenosyl-L-methionine hydrolase (adenosine-forming)
MAIVTLLTDFGDRDGFVGAMRGVLLSRVADVQLVDLAHHVPPGDIHKAARVLGRAAPCFPPGTIHLVVVDPGVGTDRLPLAGRDADGHIYVAPDNGVLEPFLDALTELHQIEPGRAIPPPRSQTFHGRDVFAPAAGWLAAGFEIGELGAPVDGPVRLDWGVPEWSRGRWRGRVQEVDRFGNLITDLRADAVGPRCRLWVADRALSGPQVTYAAARPGQLVLVVGSEGTLEVAVRDGSAAERLEIGVGAPVTCLPEPAAG